jgi:hypothetical protein
MKHKSAPEPYRLDEIINTTAESDNAGTESTITPFPACIHSGEENKNTAPVFCR